MNSPFFCAPLAALLLCSGPAFADALPALDRASVAVGVFSNRLNIDGRIDGSADFQGSQRDFDETLRFGNRREISLYEASFLLGDRHQIDLRRYSDERIRTVELNESLSFNGEVFPVQASLRGNVAFSVDEFAYGYWFREQTRSPVGLQLGVLRLEGRLGLRGRIQIDDVGEAEGGSEVREHVYAPLIGLNSRHSLGERWRLFGEARWIRLHIGGVRGDALSARVGIEYFPWENVGLALQYGGSRIAAEQSKDDLAGELEVGFAGPQMLLRLRF